jgi:hypothetical protein
MARARRSIFVGHIFTTMQTTGLGSAPISALGVNGQNQVDSPHTAIRAGLGVFISPYLESVATIPIHSPVIQA